jgi:glyoxylase-like metal-dependent hydrolase (beta-lactamase superfamily II)
MLVAGVPLWVAETNAWVIAPERGSQAVVVDAPPESDGIADLLLEHDLTPVALLVTHGHVDHVGAAGAFVERYSVSAYIHPERWELLAGDDQLAFAGIDFDVLHTPGHTPGHCCFHVPSEGLLFSGDQLFAGSIGRTDLPGGDYDALMMSMRERIVPLPPETTVFPGHGATTTLAAELATYPFLQDLHP